MTDSSLQKAGCNVSCFTRIFDCLEQLHSRRPCDLLVVDAKMPQMNTTELLTKVRYIAPSLPVLVIIGNGDVTMAVAALKIGASDVIEKPLNMENLLSAVELTLKGNTRHHPPVNKVLTKTEMGILRLILDGKSNKEMARLRNRSIRTIEKHRWCIMHKLGVDNLVDLVKKVAVVKLPELLDNR
ncbi:MAG: response regulator transcription factor [Planctomycetota bacterium]